MSSFLVRTEGVSRTHLHGRVVALDRVDLTVSDGEFVCILGDSGSGKTTLLNMLGGLDSPTAGRVYVDGVDLSTVRNADRFRAEKVGFVFQLHNLVPTLTAFENVQLPMCAVKASPKTRKGRATELLEAVGLRDRLSHKPAMLSGGERQRVAIARALANGPALILGDEPTGTLDDVTGGEIIELMIDLKHRAGTTLIIVTHDAKVAARSDRIVRLDKGRMIAGEA